MSAGSPTPLRIRPEAHKIDTLARRLVPEALPASWEHRELTGRDYGIDMTVDLFDSSASTGSFLLIQIKGTQSKIASDVAHLSFDLPVANLRYSELFVAPVLLAVCPVNVTPAVFYYLWLQGYRRIVLDVENPKWRENRKTVRVKIPTDNRMPGSERHLSFIAAFPHRLFGWTQVARILHELRFVLNRAPEEIDVREALGYLKEARSLRCLFEYGSSEWLRYVKTASIDPGIRAAELLLSGAPYTIEEVESAGVGINRDAVDASDQAQLAVILRIALIDSANRLSVFLATANDYGLARTLWAEHGEHDF